MVACRVSDVCVIDGSHQRFRRASCLDVLDRAGDPALLVSNGHRQRHVVSLVMSKIVCLATR